MKFSKNRLILGAFGLSGAAALIHKAVRVRALSPVVGSRGYGGIFYAFHLPFSSLPPAQFLLVARVMILDDLC